MHLLVYMSDFNQDVKPIEVELKDITTKSRKRNPNLDITGALFHHEGKFLQILEGNKSNIDDLMEIISHDPRHSNIQVFVNEKISHRKLPDWNMDSLNLDIQTPLAKNEIALLTDVYKQNLVVETDALIHFYKAMLKTRAMF